MTVRTRREEYAAMTRAALLDAASELFIRDGFAATSVDDIAQRARVSKGAVYHHFPDKRTIFDEVFRTSQLEVMTRFERAALSGDTVPWEQATSAAQAFLRAYVNDEGKRALLRQSAAVLGAERCRQIDEELALPQLRCLLQQLADRGELQAVSLNKAAVVIFGTLCEAATSVAFADEPARVCEEVGQVVHHMLSGLRRQPTIGA